MNLTYMDIAKSSHGELPLSPQHIHPCAHVNIPFTQNFTDSWLPLLQLQMQLRRIKHNCEAQEHHYKVPVLVKRWFQGFVQVFGEHGCMLLYLARKLVGALGERNFNRICPRMQVIIAQSGENRKQDRVNSHVRYLSISLVIMKGRNLKHIGLTKTPLFDFDLR